MKKIDVTIVILSCLSLFFIGMSVFADKSTFVGITVTFIGYGSLFISSCLSFIKIILQRNKND